MNAVTVRINLADLEWMVEALTEAHRYLRDIDPPVTGMRSLIAASANIAVTRDILQAWAEGENWMAAVEPQA